MSSLEALEVEQNETGLEAGNWKKAEKQKNHPGPTCGVCVQCHLMWYLMDRAWPPTCTLPLTYYSTNTLYLSTNAKTWKGSQAFQVWMGKIFLFLFLARHPSSKLCWFPARLTLWTQENSGVYLWEELETSWENPLVPQLIPKSSAVAWPPSFFRSAAVCFLQRLFIKFHNVLRTSL